MNTRFLAAALCSICTFATLTPTVLDAQETDQDLGTEIEALKTGQQEIRKELAEIKKLIQARQAAAPAKRQAATVKDVVFDLGDNPIKGESTAKLTLVEFSDYQ